MSNISSISINDIIYDLKDKNAVPLTGGTMTGTLKIDQNQSLQLIDSKITLGVPPVEKDEWAEGIYMKDSANNTLGQIKQFYQMNGIVGLDISTYRNDLTNIFDNYLRLQIDALGVKSISVSDPIIWRNALGASNGVWSISQGGTSATTAIAALENLGAVAKSGDTMLGRLKFSSDGFETNHDNGYVTDEWGNFIHKSANTANYWGIYNNAVENKFRVFFETGDATTMGNISIVAPPNSARLIFKNPSKSNRGVMLSFAEDDDNNVSRFYFYQMKSNNGNYDLFKLPATKLSETTNGTYDILTTKSPVTIAQGGTSATTAANAWANLGGGSIGKKNSLVADDIPELNTSKITAGILPLERGGTGASTLPTARKALYGTNLNSSAEFLVAITDKYADGGWIKLPLPTTHGGTGGSDSGWKSYKNSNVFSGEIFYRKIGNFGEIYAYGIKLNSDLTTNSGITLGSIDSNYAPSKGFMQVFGSSYTSGLINVSSAGAVKLYKDRNISSLSSTWTIYWNVMYLL